MPPSLLLNLRIQHPSITKMIATSKVASTTPTATATFTLPIKYDLIFLFYLSFLSQTFTIHRTAGEGRGHLFNSSLPLPPASQTRRHQPDDYCRELTSTHSQHADSNRERLVSERKLLTTNNSLENTRGQNGI